MRTRAVCCVWSDVGSPGSRATSSHTYQVLRPRRAVWALAFTRPSVLPSAFATASAPGIRIFTRLNGWPVCSPTDASPPPLQATAHGSGPMWLATPSSYRTCTDYSLPVSRRTAKDSGHYQIRFTEPQIELVMRAHPNSNLDHLTELSFEFDQAGKIVDCIGTVRKGQNID